MFYKINDVMGHIVDVKKTDPKHLAGHIKGKPQEEPTPEGDFSQMFVKALTDVNNKQLESMALGQKMVTDPDSVNVHEVMITSAEANMGLSIAKAVIDRVIRGYREITSLR
ncbi:MAG: flagellar hook-basal body complex protein FliE [Spirochaetales bacterium]|nr:flagellar hook-basal body complex protein FliE [Spirochaetales bacterium]